MISERSKYSFRLLSGLVALFFAALVQAQNYPARPVTLVVPFAVGSSTDIMTRLVAKGLNDRLKTAFFIVDNKPGANGAIGSEYVAHAKPDGYTLLVGTGTTHTQVPWMMKSIRYDPMKDFEPVAGIGGVPLAVLVGLAERGAREIRLLNRTDARARDLARELGDLDRIEAWLRVFGMVNVGGGFNRFPAVINGFTDLIVEVFGPEVGAHARSVAIRLNRR